jgi:hypothetical protein
LPIFKAGIVTSPPPASKKAVVMQNALNKPILPAAAATESDDPESGRLIKVLLYCKEAFVGFEGNTKPNSVYRYTRPVGCSSKQTAVATHLLEKGYGIKVRINPSKPLYNQVSI